MPTWPSKKHQHKSLDELDDAYEKAQKYSHGGKCTSCGGEMPCLAHGGEISEKDRVKRMSSDKGTSPLGHSVREANRNNDYSKHPSASWPEYHEKRGKEYSTEAKHRAAESLTAEYDRPKPKLQGLAKGGEVEPMDEDHDLDNEMNEMLADELMNAFEKKDKKGILEAIQALVLSCKE